LHVPLGEGLAREDLAQFRVLQKYSRARGVEGVVVARPRERLAVEGEPAIAAEVAALGPATMNP
jgi:hypothetical protein